MHTGEGGRGGGREEQTKETRLGFLPQRRQGSSIYSASMCQPETPAL